MSTVDNVTPGDKWEFDASVAACFDDMLKRSIPGYDQMRTLTRELVVNRVSQLSTPMIVDVGASRGGSFADLIPALPGARFVALEISDPMLKVLEQRFAGLHNVEVLKYDLRSIRNDERRPPFRVDGNDVVLSVLTLQFTPLEHRQKILARIYESLKPGGMFVLVEKLVGDDHVMNDLLVDNYYATKRAHGYSREQIATKAASLEGVLVPLSRSAYDDMLRKAGFAHVDTYWQAWQFCGMVAVK